MAKKKISKNQIDKNPPLYGIPGDSKILEIDPAEIRIAGYNIKSSLSLGFNPGQFDDGYDDNGSIFTDPTLANLLPKIEDISIYSEEIDYSTTPATVKLTLKIKNSTGYSIKGIKGRRPPS